MKAFVVFLSISLPVVGCGQSKPVANKSTWQIGQVCYDSDGWMGSDQLGNQFAITVKYPCGHPEKAECSDNCPPAPTTQSSDPSADSPSTLISYVPPPCKAGDTKHRQKGFDGKYFYWCKPKPSVKVSKGINQDSAEAHMTASEKAALQRETYEGNSASVPKTTQSYDGCNTTTYVDGQPASTTAVYCPSKSFIWAPEKNKYSEFHCHPDAVMFDPADGSAYTCLDGKYVKVKPATMPVPSAGVTDITAGTGITYTATFALSPVAASASDSVNKGVYTFTFTDPNNRWRCQVASVGRNDGADEASTATIVCSRPIPVTDTP